ncbi:protein PBDC1 isoform X2 [Neomonachus schauinslandi]|uniref:Protein PBDC1 isoform X2 n=1 Tax=Neomonachus schauinslandi TaxID=29088 RepID=A0A2Y9GVQ6_NEOSC|nr:protein PBDC1 isoform X2 [Neomonachus schauinslandi]
METTSGTGEPVAGELVSVAHALSLPAESYGNDPDIEMAWAMKAMQHAEVYYKLISSVDPQFLKLTKVDDQIYSEFRENFEKLRIDVLDPEELKSESAKEPPGYNFLPLKLLGTGKAITKQFTPVFMTKKRKKATMEERKELTVEGQKRKEPTEKEKKQKPVKEQKKRKEPTKKSARVVKQLCKVDKEQHSGSCDSTKSTDTVMLLARTPVVKCMSLCN